MGVIQKHHITYEPEWIVEIPARWHREITFIQRRKATPEFEYHLRNLIMALNHELNRVNLQLYQAYSRNMNPK